MLTGAAVGRGLLSVLTFCIPVPVAAIGAAWLWLHFDKSSAVRTAVDKAVTELVAGARIKALEDTLDGERRLRMYAEGKRDEALLVQAELQKNADQYQNDLTLSELDNENHVAEIEALKRAPAPGGCCADAAYVGGLHNN